MTRRDVLTRAAHGFGALALQYLLQREGFGKMRMNPLAPKPPHFPAKAKSVIFLYMVGAPSHIDTFDPKPALKKYEGQQLPESFGKIPSQFTNGDTPLLSSPWQFKKYGQSGIEVSSLYPHLAQHVDDICFVRSFYTESVVHAPAMYQVHTGRILMGYPSMGSWVTYGLGSESDSLPAYVVMPQPEGTPEGGTPCWGAGFLPAVYQGTLLRGGANPILNLKPPAGMTPERQRSTLDLLQKMNDLDTADGDTEMAARISSYELAFKMQSHAPEAVDLSQESESTRRMYGLDEKRTADFGTRCLLARRMVERGVRFVMLMHASWDQHTNLNRDLKKNCDITDQPTAALIKDLKQRGLLDSTLIIWGGEFGRTPMVEIRKASDPENAGRDHHPLAYSMWVAGGGIKGGQVVGKTDDFGFTILEDKIHVHDLQATVLHCLGLDHTRLTYHYLGRDFRLTDVAGEVVGKLVG